MADNFLVIFDSVQIGVCFQEFIVIMQQHWGIIDRRETNGWNVLLRIGKKFDSIICSSMKVELKQMFAHMTNEATIGATRKYVEFNINVPNR